MQPLALSCVEPAFRFVCDFYKEQHHRHFGQHANRCGKCGRRGCSEQGNGYCNRQFKEVGCADHSGRCCNAVRQLEQPTGTISMVFKERLKEKRTEANLTQVELAEKAGVTARTIQNYELGSRKPSNMVTIQKIADALNTTTEYLLGSSGTYVVEAHEKDGAKAAKDIEELVSEVTGMFTGGELSEDAIEGAYKALTDAYWIAKENNKKYAPKTRRKKSDQ